MSSRGKKKAKRVVVRSNNRSHMNRYEISWPVFGVVLGVMVFWSGVLACLYYMGFIGE